MNGRFPSVMSGILMAGAVASAMVMSLPAQAFQLTLDSLNSTSTNSPATGASSLVNFDFVEVSAGVVDLVLTLKNTTGSVDNALDAGADASKFVGFGFNLPDFITGYDYNANGSTFTQLYGIGSLAGSGAVNESVNGAASISGAGGGSNIFDIGIRSAGNGNGNGNTFQGGNPNGGLNASESVAVNFRLFGSGITASSVETAFVGLFGDSNTFNVASRFQAVSGEGFSGASDKLLGGIIVSEPDPEPVEIPEPASTLGLVALVGAGLTLRRRSMTTDS